MKRTKMKICLSLIALLALASWGGAAFAAAARGGAIISTGAKATVREKVASDGLYDEGCRKAYFGCMDQFCISDNESGGSCVCSADYDQYGSALKKIEKNNDEANRIATVEVEKAQAGAKADILFSETGTREYDKDGKVVTVHERTNARKRRQPADMSAWLGNGGDEEASLDGLTGRELYNGAHRLCTDQADKACKADDLKMLTQVYLTQIRSDCTALSKVIKDLEKQSEVAILDAQRDLRDARDEAFARDNEYDRGACMVEFKKCMMKDDACGADWTRCVRFVAEENMQKKTVSTAGTTVASVDKFQVSASVQEMLSSKRNICESVLDKCLANRQYIWDDFLRDVAPELKIAELGAESKRRQRCLGDISDCIQKACKDNIEGKNGETMDSCLSRPTMARSFCKVEIDPCERMEPQIWDYVVDRLASMRVDACTKEVKDCFTSPDRCGEDFSQCIGMDYKYMHDLCPLDKLLVCKQARKDFKMSDIDQMLMGFYLNVDNAALDVCQKLIDDKMTEVCGSTVDCNRFAADDTLGTGSLRSQKVGDIYRVTGMLSFGMIKMGNGSKVCDSGKEDESCGKEDMLKVGEIGVKDYIAEVRKKNSLDQNNLGIIDSIEAELNNIAGTINRTISMIETDQKIQYCIEGRDLSQINGKGGGGRGGSNTTKARFPNLLNNQKTLIAASALRRANDNYNKKFNDEVAEAVRKADLDIAQFMCQKMATGGGVGGLGSTEADTPLAPPYSISYDVGSGLTKEQLMQGGAGSFGSLGGGASSESAGYLIGGWSSTKVDGGVTTKTDAMFDRNTRNCHICKQTTKKECKAKGSVTVLFVHVGGGSDCSVDVGEEKCEDIPM